MSPSENIQKLDNFPGKKILRKMGYLKDQEGIINRYLREREGWEEHLEKSRKFILESVRVSTPVTIAVLGSGWLLDFPLEEVYRVCPDIHLVDIHHPPQILRKIRDFPGVVPVQADITGGMINNIWKFTRKFKKDKDILNLSQLEYVKPELIRGRYPVSLNVLNQLDILLVDYLKKYFDFNDDVYNDFRKFVQNSHLGLFGKHGCLITDVKEINKSFNTGETKSKDLIHAKLPKGKRAGEWTWHFDSAGLYHEQSVTTMLVKAISF